jgi:toxin ParE1/3/4
MRVVWTPLAERHLDDIFRFIAESSPDYALRMVDRLTRRSQQLGRFPESGRAVPEIGREAIREVFEGSYRLIYGIKAAQVDVIAVIHSARLLRSGDLESP